MGVPIPMTEFGEQFLLNPHFLTPAWMWTAFAGAVVENDYCTITGLSGWVNSPLTNTYEIGDKIRTERFVTSNTNMKHRILVAGGGVSGWQTGLGLFTATYTLHDPRTRVSFEAVSDNGPGNLKCDYVFAYAKTDRAILVNKHAITQNLFPHDTGHFHHDALGGGRHIIRLANKEGRSNCLFEVED